VGCFERHLAAASEGSVAKRIYGRYLGR